MLYRDAHMTGWAYKEITTEDLKFPVVYGEGKRSRLLATIGVTRGFGDHDLKAQSSSSQTVYIKPFLTPQPEVRVLDVENEDINDSDVLVMATDGLWDVVTNERVAEIVHNGINIIYPGNTKSVIATSSHKDDTTAKEVGDIQIKRLSISDEVRKKYRFISIAQELVMAARGKLVDRNWRRTVPVVDNGDRQAVADGIDVTPQTQQVPATIDDISVFVIPILAYKEEYLSWKKEKLQQRRENPAENTNIMQNSESESNRNDGQRKNVVSNAANQLANGEHDNRKEGYSGCVKDALEDKTAAAETTASGIDHTDISDNVQTGGSSGLTCVGDVILDDNMSIEEALDAIIHEEDSSKAVDTPNSTNATLEIKETEDDSDFNLSDDEVEK